MKKIKPINKYKDDLWDISEIKVGTILRDWFDDTVRVIIMRGPASMNVYLGIPPSHPLAGFNYDDLPISCHGGLTFGDLGHKYWPVGYYWYGYDFAHSGDFPIFDEKGANEIHKKFSHLPSDEHKWTIKEIVDDSWNAIYDFKKLIKITEGVARK